MTYRHTWIERWFCVPIDGEGLPLGRRQSVEITFRYIKNELDRYRVDMRPDRLLSWTMDRKATACCLALYETETAAEPVMTLDLSTPNVVPEQVVSLMPL